MCACHQGRYIILKSNTSSIRVAFQNGRNGVIFKTTERAHDSVCRQYYIETVFKMVLLSRVEPCLTIVDRLYRTGP